MPLTTTVHGPRPLAEGTLRIVPVGGLGEIGRNMTVSELDGKLLVVDCGVLFPEEHQPGVDLILPDFSPVRDRLDDVLAALAEAAEQGTRDLHAFSQVVRRTTGRWVASKHRRRPMIVPVVVAA